MTANHSRHAGHVPRTSSDSLVARSNERIPPTSRGIHAQQGYCFRHDDIAKDCQQQSYSELQLAAVGEKSKIAMCCVPLQITDFVGTNTELEPQTQMDQCRPQQSLLASTVQQNIGHGTDPTEQKTQQAPFSDFSLLPHPVQRQKTGQTFVGMVALDLCPQCGHMISEIR